jgi:hypothetical protein
MAPKEAPCASASWLSTVCHELQTLKPSYNSTHIKELDFGHIDGVQQLAGPVRKAGHGRRERGEREASLGG